jgi:Holliday junction resolvase RusA-like endonuclease
LKADAPMNHTGRPDIDNLLKFVMDALNGVFYKDDSQICQVFTLKQYNTRPGTLVEIVEL